MPPVWPTVTDDIGDKISGTIFNKAFTDAVKTYVDGWVVAPGNPAVLPGTITDEVIAARGTKVSLDARLDVALNEDGTPKPVAGQATETQVGRQVNGQDLARNRWMAAWSNGATAAPDFYVLAGAGAAIQQCGVGLADTTQVGVGRFTARVTSAAGAAAELQQQVIMSTELDDFTAFRGRKVNFAIRGFSAGPNIYRLIVTDGVNTTSSGYNPLGGIEENLSIQHTVAATATMLQVSVEVLLGTNTAYIGGFSVVFGDVLPAYPEAAAELEPYRGALGETRLVAKNTAGAITGVNPTFTWPMPANSLPNNQGRILVEATGAFTANANNKAVDLFINTHTLRIIPLAAHNIANNVWRVVGYLVRVSNTSVLFDGLVTYDAATGAAPTVQHISSVLAAGAVDFTTAMNVQVQVNCAAGDGSIVRVFFRLEP